MKKKISQSIRAKTFLSMLALLAACCLMIYGIVMLVLPQNYYTDLEDQVADDFDALLDTFDEKTWAASTDEIERFAVHNHALVNIINDSGEVLYSVNHSTPEPGSPVSIVRRTHGFGAMFTEGMARYYLMVSAARVTAARPLAVLVRLLPLITAAILLVSVVGAYLLSRYYSRPLIAISQTARQMAALDLTGQCEVRRQDEIGVLAASLNEMSAQLSTALADLQAANGQLKQDIEREREQERQRVEFFTAVSHELKTPIAIIKGQLEGMIYQVGDYKDRDTYLRHCLKTTNDMEALVKEILAAARLGGSDFRLVCTDLDFSGLLQSVCRKFLGPMEDKQIALTLAIQPGVHCRGDLRLLEKAFDNVLSNAVAYSPAGARITVRLQEGVCTIENTGIQIAEEDLARLFTPFYRVDKSRSRNSGGSGLGLYITKTILDRHGIRHTLANTENGVKFTAFLQ
ncbi:MAG TPA: HAMP domain-containing histidine kinase [Candidatus Gemmiger avicola]|uniref:histidine kinase n=1 Tax=Candidatus Gemmiger avicola TaxID=2838605 RepID=A0A9D2M7E7_9FIRM|nr:HAMP domain-containing histidine kinase [Candidatus Gemmiger avicola]